MRPRFLPDTAMLSFFPSQHALHAPSHEFFRGQLVPCHETPARAASVQQALQAAGHRLSEPQADSRALLPQVHSPRYLGFLEQAWSQWLALDAANAERQPWPSTWPVRSLRDDREPEEFSARLGLYSFDSGTPMSAGTWAAAKAGADAALSAARSPCRPRLHGWLLLPEQCRGRCPGLARARRRTRGGA
jgi:acetoin utilization deacetylase AcuC-like enzyme